MNKQNYILAIGILFSGCTKAQRGILGFPKPNLHNLFQPMTGTLIIDKATGTWENNQALESSIFYDSATSNVKVYYTGSSDVTSSSFDNRIGFATSSDMTTFTKYASNPVIGEGNGGAPANRRAHSSWVGKIGTTYYAFATNGYGYNYTGEDRNIYMYTSANGTTWTDLGLKLDKNTAWAGGTLAGFGNFGLCTTPQNTPVVINGKYVAIVEANTGSYWELFRAEATSITGTWTITNKLTSLQVKAGATYSGACLIYSNGVYHCFYHYGALTGNVPTYLAYATSTDVVTWTIKEAPFMKIEATPYPNTDQIGDAFVTEINGKVYLTAEYVQNAPTYFGQLRLWSYNGTFNQMISTLN